MLLKRPLKRHNNDLNDMTNGSFMTVESIAECSPWNILLYFDLYEAIIGLCGLFESGSFTQVLLY